MYLLNFSLFIKHLLPPTWRDSWQETLIQTLLSPLKESWTRFEKLREPKTLPFGENIQALPLEARCSAIMGSRVLVEHRSTRSYTVYISVKRPSLAAARVVHELRKNDLKRFLSKNLLASTSYLIVRRF